MNSSKLFSTNNSKTNFKPQKTKKTNFTCKDNINIVLNLLSGFILRFLVFVVICFNLLRIPKQLFLFQQMNNSKYDIRIEMYF